MKIQIPIGIIIEITLHLLLSSFFLFLFGIDVRVELTYTEWVIFVFAGCITHYWFKGRRIMKTKPQLSQTEQDYNNILTKNENN